MIKITDVKGDVIWVNPCAINAVCIPSLLNPKTECRILLAGGPIFLDVSRLVANDVMMTLDDLHERTRPELSGKER